MTVGDDQAVPRGFASWDEYWAVRHDCALWEPFFAMALRSAGFPTAEVVMQTPSQYPTARAGDAIITIYPETSIAGNACAMDLEAHALITGLGLPVPDLIAHGTFKRPSDDLSWNWLIEAAAEGAPWSRAVAELSDEQAQRCATDLGVTIRRLHETPHETATILAPVWTRFHDLVSDESVRLGVNDGRLDGFPETIRPWLRDLAAETLAALDTDAPTKLLHGDIHGDNVFVDPATGRLTGLIDLNEMSAGSAWYDLADAAFRLFDGAPGLTDRLLRGYGLDPSSHDYAGVLLGWALLHDFDGITTTIEQRGIPEGADLDKLAAHLTGLGRPEQGG